MRIDPKDIIEQLRHNLERYPYEDGFTVLRELLQNADDARAKQVTISLLPGWPEATNQLLRGPGLLIVNDGCFDRGSADGMQTFGGSIKAADSEAVGRFGLGQKSVFHFCDAFLVVPSGYEQPCDPFVVNPFMVLAQDGDACRSWNDLSDSDLEPLRAWPLPLAAEHGKLLLWFPFRRQELRPKPKSQGIVAADIDPLSFTSLADKWRLAILLASLRHVERLEVRLSDRSVILSREGAARLFGYSLLEGERSFGGPITLGLASVGRERMGAPSFRKDLRGASSWPRTRNRQTDEEEVQKAEPHGAVILIRDPLGIGQLDVDWSVLLPVAPADKSTQLATKGRVALLLHGCFFVDSGRKSILGFDASAGSESAETGTKRRWNEALRDEVLLPLVPATLFDGFQAQMFAADDLATLLLELNHCAFGKSNRAAMASRQSLARAIEPTGKGASARWRLLPATADLRPLPAPDARGNIAAVDLFPGLSTWAEQKDLTLIAGADAALIAAEPKWQANELSDLLSKLSPTAFQQGGRTDAVADFLQVAVGKDEHLRQTAAEQLILTLRETLGRTESLAHEGQIRAVLAYLPAGSAIALPKSAGAPRDILRALAAVADAPICLRMEWLTDGVARTGIEPTEAARLLSALQPLLSSHTNAEAAGTAALALVKLLGTRLATLMKDPQIAQLAILRASDGSGTSRLVSLADLAAASGERKLFSDSPNVQRMLKALHEAAPGSGALVLGGDAAALLAEIGEPFAFAKPSKESFARLILRAESFGSIEARAKYLSEYFTQSPEVRSAFRCLAAGRDCGEGAKLFALGPNMGPLADFSAELISASNDAFLVSPEIIDVLKTGEQRHLGVQGLDGASLGTLFRDNSAAFKSRPIDRDMIVVFMRSDISDDDLRMLPIFPATNGSRLCAAEIWNDGPDFRIPKPLSGIVPILDRTHGREANDRMARLISAWSPEAQIRFALRQNTPQSLASEILDALYRVASTARDGVTSVKWLKDRKGEAWAPDDVLDLPEPVLSAARPLFDAKATAVFLPIDELAEDLRTPKVLEALRKHKILPDTAGSVDRLLMLVQDASPIAWIGGDVQDTAQDLHQLAMAGANLGLPGWPLLSELLRMPESEPENLIRFFGTIPAGDHDLALALMTSLAELSKSGNNYAWTHYRAVFAALCGRPVGARNALFRDIQVRTEADTWLPGRDVARGGDGLARSHLLHRELRSKLPQRIDLLASQSESTRAPHGQQMAADDPARMERQSADSLQPILDYARPHVPSDLLLLLVGLVGRSAPFRAVAINALAVADVDVTRIWSRFDTEVAPNFKPQMMGETLDEKRKSRFISFVPVASSPTTVEAETLAGEIKSFPVGDIQPMGIVGDIHIGWQNVWQGKTLLGIRELKIATIADHTVKPEHAKALCMTLAEVLIGYRKEQPACHEALSQLADACDRIDQSTVDSARAELEDRLPQVLDELKPKTDSGLWKASKAYRASVDSIPVGEQREKSRPGAKKKLWQEVSKAGVQKELLGVIRSRIEDYGYSPTRILFELFQNADDATLQHPGTGPGRFSVAFGDDRLVARHWGRLINHPGADPQEGERRGWRNDLFNMLLMNLSEKREDVTGRFGLGFKSVHLIADEVGIASHFVACKVRGGMLPETWDDGRQVSVKSRVDGRPATVIDLHIDSGRRAQMNEAKAAFCEILRWLPAMSRAIRCIEVEGHGIWRAEVAPLAEDGLLLVSFSGPKPGHAIALDLGDEATLFIPLGAYGPVAAEENLPRLWLLAPLEETSASGWLMNGRQFRVDPGRGRLAGTVEERQAIFARFGMVLGQRLVSLHDLIVQDWQKFSVATGISDPNPETGYAGFARALGDLFEKDLGDDLSSHMHGVDRGLGRLFSERPALATGLPLPFAPFLRAGGVKHVLTGALADRQVLVALKGWQMIQTVGTCSVGAEAALRLECLGFPRPRPFGLADALRHEIGLVKRISPDLADRLGAVLTEGLMTEIDKDEERTILEVLKTALFQMADGTWRTAALPPSQVKDSDEEEGLVLAFAPNQYRAEKDYTGKGLVLYRLAMRQSGFQRSASDFAKWAESMDEDTHKRALLRYVVEGRQGTPLGNILAEKRPFWILAESDEMRASPLVTDLSADELPKLLGLLYPEEQRRRWSEDFVAMPPLGTADVLVPDVADPERFLGRLHDWWEINHKAERQKYEQTAYPEGFHLRSLCGKDAEAEADRLAWFTFFALAIFRTLGRTHEGAHRHFVTKARSAGWWQEMALASLPDNPEPWLRRLEDFARPEAWRIDYPQWRRALADLYVLSRWLPDYVDAYRNLPAVIRQSGPIALSDLWRLSASPLWQRRGLEGAPLSQSLGLGANWMIREGLRAGIWPDQDRSLLSEHGWAASGRLRRVFKTHLSHNLGETAHMDLSPKVFHFIKKRLGPLSAFHGDLDLPLQIVSHGSRASVLAEIVGLSEEGAASAEDDFDAQEDFE